jgi:glycerol-3-phosphate dehydrogenase (NAD(P)+)
MLAGRTVDVRLWCRDAARAEELCRGRENKRLLPGVPIPEGVTVTGSAAVVGEAELWVIAIPMSHLRSACPALRPAFPKGVPVLSLSKGVEPNTGSRPCQLLAEEFSPGGLASMSGPSHAEEVARGMPTSVVVASEDAGLAESIQQLFNTERFRVYTSDDLTGVELAGALKNVIGLAAGICDGLGYGDNAKSALLTRGLAEMARYGLAHGARVATFQGLAGMGDLITTCFSRHGRNRRVGERLGRGEKLADVLAHFDGVAEGVETCRGVVQTAERLGVDMPICRAVHQVLFEGKDPTRAVAELMRRPLRGERDGGQDGFQ